MFSQHSGKALAAILSASMLLSTALPAAAFAATQVQVEDHAATAAQAREVDELVIGGVEAPESGKALDDVATVRAADGTSWDIPVLWIGSDLRLATEANEGMTYVPALAFFVPDSYRVKAEGGSYAVTLSDELEALFGTKEVVSVFDAATGISYILPARLKDYFAPRTGLGGAEAATPAASAVPAAAAVVAAQVAAEAGPEAEVSLIDVYCSKTARDALSTEDLEWLLDLILNKLQPEAVNLLIEKFPAFSEGAEKGEIGKEIGLYVYFLKGDKDGIASHEGAVSEALAYVSDEAMLVEGVYRFGYLVGIDLSSLAKKNADGSFATDSATGKYILLREGTNMETFENTIVHEHFHALMDDYNRVGMTGVLAMKDYVTKPDGSYLNDEIADQIDSTRLPTWFIEGSASAVENVYAFRYRLFDVLRTKDGEVQGSFDVATLVDNYINAKDDDGKPRYLDLWYAAGYNEDGKKISNTASAYVCGYLATLYLCELQARKGGTSSIVEEGQSYYVSSDVLRGGLNDILKRLHDGETLDEIVRDISPVVDGAKIYRDTTEFQKKFIKGSFYTSGGPVDTGRYLAKGDFAQGQGSVAFACDLLNYFERVGAAEGRQNNKANGSILFDFARDFATPLDRTTNDASLYLNFVKSNAPVVSTVPDSQALKDGGKSASGTPGHDSPQPATKDEYPQADIRKEAPPSQSTVSASSDEGLGEVALATPLTLVAEPADEALPLAAKATDAAAAHAPEGEQGDHDAAAGEAAAVGSAEGAEPVGDDATSARGASGDAAAAEADAAAQAAAEPAGDQAAEAASSEAGVQGSAGASAVTEDSAAATEDNAAATERQAAAPEASAPSADAAGSVTMPA